MIGTALRRLAIAGVGIAAMSCVQPSTVDDGTVAPATHDRSVLSYDELHTMGDQYLYDVVQRLRPDWLREHGATSIASGVGSAPDPVHVYVGIVRLGGPEVLTRLETAAATSLKYYTPAEAQSRFGPGNVNGVIQVISTPPPPSP